MAKERTKPNRQKQEFTQELLSADEAAKALAKLQGARKPAKKLSGQSSTGAATEPFQRGSSTTKDDSPGKNETSLYRQFDEERLRRIESGIESNINTGLTNIKSDVQRDLGDHKLSLLKWGIGIFVPTLLTLIIYHFTVLQSFKKEIIDQIEMYFNKHDLADAQKRLDENLKKHEQQGNPRKPANSNK